MLCLDPESRLLMGKKAQEKENSMSEGRQWIFLSICILSFFPGMKSWPDQSYLVKAFSIKSSMQIYLKALMICTISNSDQRGIEIHLTNPPEKREFPAFAVFFSFGSPFYTSIPPVSCHLPHCTSSSTGRLSGMREEERIAVSLLMRERECSRNG